MIRPALTFLLWLAIAALVLVNNMIGDTAMADRLTVLEVEWYKVLVPLPYVLMMAVIHGRRCAGPKWLEAALLAALLWPPTTVLIDFLYGRFTFGMEPVEFLDRFAFWWGAPYPLLVAALFVAPLAVGWLLRANAPRVGGT
ncbi:MAG: hypothetical protein JSS04_22770 [Proteobacteria bacterium]|nr:hypothetical protein [Pseudomonadota bacterium]